jgi:hypothetical protein
MFLEVACNQDRLKLIEIRVVMMMISDDWEGITDEEHRN